MEAAAKISTPRWRVALFVEAFGLSGGAAWGMEAAAFSAVLEEVCRKYLAPDAGEKETRAFIEALRLRELALARACAAGEERAWTEFLNRYREPLYSAALAITRNDPAGRELADSLYAELYGMKERVTAQGSERFSKLSTYTGRGSLEGWLRTVLAQSWVDRYRKQRRLVSLEEETEAGRQFPAAESQPVPASDSRLASATEEALAALPAEDRVILAAYFLDERTLAEIGGMLAVHESTISRRLERIIRDLRKRILKTLAQRGMSARAAEEALEVDVRDLALNVAQRLRPQKEERI
jgi:RNA polymerase sigma-70 factor (ECF subfamily)